MPINNKNMFNLFEHPIGLCIKNIIVFFLRLLFFVGRSRLSITLCNLQFRNEYRIECSVEKK